MKTVRFKLSPVEVGKIKRKKALPSYDFIERWLGFGRGYTFGDGGYCVVAPSECLLSDFIVELVVPRTESRGDLKAMMSELAKVSCGFMWLDTGDTEAFEFAWRLGLALKPVAPLFAWDTAARRKIDLKGLSVAPAREEDIEKTIEMLTSFPPNRGGQVKEEVLEKIGAGMITSLWYRRRHAGSAILQPQRGGYAALTLVLDPEFRGKGLTTRFGTLLARKLAAEGTTLLASMPSVNLASYRACVSAGMKIIKRAFIARLTGA